MEFWRRSARISGLDRTRNERIREIMNVEKDLVEQIEELKWYGHVEQMPEETISIMVLN